eukprot:CAMPEP_0172554884 /NCGR_PEP_ID=MMETSP1067-20121228/56866_1 /TAXON_ID=265564 ORGANISM="Thalassiosira punctigera, Strain Tpunct2005C2" /NCGR_SAMPLE_ID=MMETSP1067 /ASSEMBLY_ACC=CAM_ASM_000444 /LENGTH=488 /DNA_ID=CAMNT_0013343343 /DNA_START=110 /DNA_END=1576 /DNA_ORIENTATION=+
MTPPPKGFPVPLSRSRSKPQPEDADQAIVLTPYGRGLVVRSRNSDGIKEVQLLEWESFAKPHKQQRPFMMYTPKDYPSVTPRVGDDVVCQYGRGRVTQISRSPDAEGEPSLKYSIALSSWRLNGRSTVICHVTSPPPRVVRKHTLSEMDAHEKMELARSQKSKATNYFSRKKDYNLALTTYASAVDAVRNVQHDHSSTNEVRADLVVVMVTCSNNAATCCIKLEKWDEASKFAKNALVLLDALYGKRGKKIHTLLNKEGTIDAKLFGEWRAKSYLVVARSCMEGQRVNDAMGVLKKARGVAIEYIDEINAKQQDYSKEERASLKNLTSQVKEIRRLLVECSDKKKATKKMEKRRAKAMFGGDKESKNTEGQKQRGGTKGNEEKGRITIPAASQVVGNKGENVLHDQGEKNPHKQSSSSNIKKEDRSQPTVSKSVSFSHLPPQINEYEMSADDNDESSPWYSEHREALIMLGIAGISAVALMALRRSSR